MCYKFFSFPGTMGHFKDGNLDRGKGILYSMEKDFKLKKHLDGLHGFNGLAFSSDNKTMYFIDSIPKAVYAFDLDIDKGSISKYRITRDGSILIFNFDFLSIGLSKLID